MTKEAVQAAQDLKADSIVSVGGGSTIGLGKAISIRSGLPHVCIPKTYAGSEMTPILGETMDGTKTTRKDAAIFPEAVIYDVSLTMSLPAKISITSGINAIAHDVEALYAPDKSPIIRLQAKERLLDQLDACRALSGYGMQEIDLDRAASIEVQNQYANPRKVEQGQIRDLLRRAWADELAKADL
ncbi:hypothetical protein B5807_07939 [Epicoccum nigrum]|uniref:Alcohol dehydrogenase iron-type/glycerol dehydrogenase GldA domain-containing protein n=1 Tax=Epicoccum nigrum TaxID=105696 RepID=A0A1Y2LZT2_EPING|nr:hypothetical protein B5807_07939 [Epicoccum nigrum]